jgi:hypothetical protein
MRLVTDHSLAAGNVSVPCYVCCKMHLLADSVMDLDGPAFKAYWCPTCFVKHRLHESVPVAPCAIDGCKRGGVAHWSQVPDPCKGAST